MVRPFFKLLACTAFFSVFAAISSCKSSSFQGGSAPKIDPNPTDAPLTAETPLPDEASPTPTPIDELIEGVEVIKVGINYEDAKDGDFNDSVLCFSGKFIVDNKKIQSAEDNQNIQVVLTSRASCTHIIHVKVLGTDGQIVSENKYPDVKNGQNTFNFSISKGQFLDTTLIKSCNKNMNEHQSGNKCQILPNVCNTTGG
jgi:hypothetical protein